jgi:hypothetical protein
MKVVVDMFLFFLIKHLINASFYKLLFYVKISASSFTSKGVYKDD